MSARTTSKLSCRRDALESVNPGCSSRGSGSAYLDGGLGHGPRDVSLEDVVQVRQEGQRHDWVDCGSNGISGAFSLRLNQEQAEFTVSCNGCHEPESVPDDLADGDSSCPTSPMAPSRRIVPGVRSILFVLIVARIRVSGSESCSGRRHPDYRMGRVGSSIEGQSRSERRSKVRREDLATARKNRSARAGRYSDQNVVLTLSSLLLPRPP
jgi:hypothetical protein